MKAVHRSRNSHFLVKVSIFVILAALIAGMAGCGNTKYTLTMVVSPANAGTATALTFVSPYAAGTVVDIQAAAAAGYRFDEWTAPWGTFGDANAAQTAFTMPARDVTVTANFAEQFAGGSGTEGDPYQIADWGQLNNARNHLDKYFVLVNNLNSSTVGYSKLASPTANGGKGWQPIGGIDSHFTGTFDGQGHEIHNLFINRPDEERVALFASVHTGGTVKDVGVVNGTINGYDFVGSLVASNGGTVSNSYSSGSVMGHGGMGGLVGMNLVDVLCDGTISDSYSTCSVTGQVIVGGLVGYNWGIVSHSYSTGSVSCPDVAGGLIGADYGGSVSHSYSIASVTGEAGVGGLVGIAENSAMSNSYSSGNVIGVDEVGGLMGVNYGSTVTCSYSTGNVTGNSNVGGLAGINGGNVSSSYSSGSVVGEQDVGGLVGFNQTGGAVSSSFWDIQTSGQATSDGGTGLNTTQMQNITTFSGAGWDIIAVATANDRDTGYIWNIVSGVAYPFLSWQS
jgi:hypothetical protein